MSDNTHGRLFDKDGNEWQTMTDGELHTVTTPAGVGIDFDTVVQSGDDSLLKFENTVVADTDGRVLPYNALEEHFIALIWEHTTDEESALIDERTVSGLPITRV